MKSDDLHAEATRLEEQAKLKRAEAGVERLKEQRAMPLLDRLIFASQARCPCGAGLAYDPAGASGGYPEDGSDNDSPFRAGFSGYWDCSAILLGTAGKVEHTARLPFAFYSIKSENQPSAHGLTTRPIK